MRVTPQKKTANRIKAKKLFGDRWWRLSNLYYIQDKQGNKVKFIPNWAQEELFKNMHTCNVILKARQLGMSTAICILFLDATLFNSNSNAGIIAHTREDAEHLFKRIKFAYDNLPQAIKDVRKADTDSARELVFSNRSSIRVGTSLRSATLQYLHISELGKIAAIYPEKAREIRTGALNTVQAGQHIFIESTAEGQSGEFYEVCQQAQKLKQAGAALTPLDFKFFFFPWWQCTDYTFDYDIAISPQMRDYFEELEHKHGIELTTGQKAWYSRKADQQREDMKREFPSTPEEAFEVAFEGKYFSKEMIQARKSGRITQVPYDSALEVHVAFDLGIGDSTVIWFWQHTPGGELHIIDYYENSGESLQHYVELLRSKPYLYGKYFFPHDVQSRELSTGITRLDTLRNLGIRGTVLPNIPIADGIQQVRTIFPRCWFDEENCMQGLEHIENYRKTFSKALGCFLDKPLHDEHSDASDALRYLAVACSRTKQRGLTAEDADEMARQYGRII